MIKSIAEKFKPVSLDEDAFNEEDSLKQQLDNVRVEIKQLEQNFSNAQGNYIDIAIEELDLAKQKYGILLKKIRAVQGSTN